MTASTASPAISVVVPTFNRAESVERLLSALAAQDLPRDAFEVVVIDDGSTDETQRVLHKPVSFNLRAERQENAGPASARNRALRIARGEFVLFLDDDVVPPPDLVRRHLDAQREAPVVVIGAMLAPDGVRQSVWAEWEALMLEKQYDDMQAGRWAPTPRQFYTANASAPREAVLRAGLFDESFRRAEDVELAYRLHDGGLAFRFEPKAFVVHDTPRNLGAWMRMASQYGRYDIVMWRERGRRHILGNIAEEFEGERRAWLQRLARTAVGRAPLMAALRLAGPAAIRAASALRARRLALAGCSVVFNLLYLDGACRTFGGRMAFWAAIGTELDARSERAVEPTAEAAAG